MKTFAIFLISISLASAFEVGDKMDKIATTGGREYVGITIRAIEPDGISIMHESGTAKLKFAEMEEGMRNQFGYDPDQAAEHAAKIAAAQHAAGQREAAEIEKRREKARAASRIEKDKENLEKTRLYGREVRLEAHQNSQIGLIGDITVSKPVKRPVPGSMIETKIEWVHSHTEEGVMTDSKGAQVQRSLDTGFTDIVWSGRAWRIGKIQYLTQRGLLRTCSLFTASEAVAADFYGKNGFPPACDDLVRKSN